jgi:hypothetical protein
MIVSPVHLCTFVAKAKSSLFIRSFLNASMRMKNEENVFNGAARFKKCKQLLEYQHFPLNRDTWWSKF